MVHGMADQWGGRLVLRSQPNIGTTAELWLPIAEGDAVGAADELGPESTAARAAEGLKVIAVDDDGLVLLNTVAMLAELGHEVLAAYSAAQALEILRREPRIDLVLTDQAMPRMTGLQLAAVLHDQRPDIPVVLVTGYADLPMGTEVMIPKLVKPFRL